MNEYSPIEPGAAKKRGGWVGCLVGCLIAVGVVVILAIGAAVFVGWRLTREGPPPPEISLRDGTETLYLHARLRPDDPGVIAVAEKLLDALREAEAAGGGAPPRSIWIDSRQAAGWRSWLPIEIDVARATRAGGTPDAAVIATKFEASPGVVRAVFRIVAFLAPKEAGSSLRRTDVGPFPVVVGTPNPGIPGAEFAVALVGDRVFGAKRLEDLQAVLIPPTRPASDVEPAALAEIARLEDEDGWGYARPRAPGEADAIRLAVFSFDIVSDDVIRWRAALRSEKAPADREASAQTLVAGVAGASLPEGLGLTLDRTTRWADDRTLVVEGTVDGFAGLARGVFSALPGKGPAIPPPASPDTDPRRQT